jgi:hypothetical protein
LADTEVRGQRLGVSQQTVSNKLKSGELNGVRMGTRSAWRIQGDSTRYDHQAGLFG